MVCTRQLLVLTIILGLNLARRVLRAYLEIFNWDSLFLVHHDQSTYLYIHSSGYIYTYTLYTLYTDQELTIFLNMFVQFCP